MSHSPTELYKTHNLDPQNIPAHIAITMDGNGRWAKQQGLPRIEGHKQGRVALKKTVENCKKLGIKYLSVYAFSTENWTRPEEEVSFLMNFLDLVINKEIKELKKNGIKVQFLGQLSHLKPGLQKSLKKAEETTKEGPSLTLMVHLNYGAKTEICEALKAIVSKKTDPEDITEELISNHLYSAGIPDPDLHIRTSGEYRLSNYLLWQLSYAELFFPTILWPDFDMSELIKILAEYQTRHRRYGGL